MSEVTTIKKVGNSLSLYFDKGFLEKVYHLREGSEVEIEYGFAGIVIKPVLPAEAAFQSVSAAVALLRNTSEQHGHQAVLQ